MTTSIQTLEKMAEQWRSDRSLSATLDLDHLVTLLRTVREQALQEAAAYLRSIGHEYCVTADEIITDDFSVWVERQRALKGNPP